MDVSINKGKISAIKSKTKATVVPTFSSVPVTADLTIPWYLWECLEVGMDVAYVQFPDNTGIIEHRMDGEWNHKIWDGFELVTGNETITEGDLITSVVPSYNNHTHNCPDGTTGGPQ